MSATEDDVAGRIRALLESDPVCQGNVTGATVTAMAREWCAREALPDSDVAAERAACVAVLEAQLARIAPLAGEHEAIAIEVRRMAAAIEGVRQGLHRNRET